MADIQHFIITFGTTTYTEATTQGLPVGAVRNDTLATLANTDNEIAPLQVNASGALYIQEGSALNVSAANVTVVGTGTFVVQEDGAALTALQLIDDMIYTDDTSTHATGTSKGAGIMAAATPTDTAVAANDIGMLAMSLNRELHISLEASNATVTVDLGANNDVTTELAGSTAVAAMADADANPTVLPIGAYLMGFDGTTWDRVYVVADGDAVAAATKGFVVFGSDGANYQAVTTDAAGHLQVDVLTGGGTDTPTAPVNNYQTSASLAAGSSVDLTTPEAASKKLAQVEAWASVPFRARVYTVDNAVESSEIAVGGGQAYQSWIWKPPHRDYVTLGATAGLDAFRVEMTNLDDSLAADVHASFHYED